MIFGFMCWFFGHVVKFPVEWWQPAYCGRCGVKMLDEWGWRPASPLGEAAEREDRVTNWCAIGRHEICHSGDCNCRCHSQWNRPVGGAETPKDER